MRGNEFIKRIAALGKARGLAVKVESERGKGSHIMLRFGSASTTVRNPKDELKTGTLHAMLKQLGLTLKDISK